MGLTDQFQGFWGFFPIALSGGFKVTDLNGSPGFPADADRFFNGLQQGISLTTNMAEIKTISVSNDFGQLDQLFGRGEGPRRVDKTGAQSDGALLHGFDDQILHLGHLDGIRPPFVKAHHRRPDGPLTDQWNHIE